MRYWLMKSEPDVFSIDNLKNSPRRTAHWDGVRNYLARNLIRDQMRDGDLAFFYHSSCATPGITGIMEIIGAAHPDPTAWDPNSPYFDPKSSATAPRWYMVDVRLRQVFKNSVTLTELRKYPQLEQMPLLRRGNRLSVMPVTPQEWDFIEKLAE
jgi:predicted RNA-binding protein with PUA-like domain